MNGNDLSGKQLAAAEQYILLRRAKGNNVHPTNDQVVSMSWKGLVCLVAEYGALRASSVYHGGSVDEPGEVYLTGKKRKPMPRSTKP